MLKFHQSYKLSQKFPLPLCEPIFNLDAEQIYLPFQKHINKNGCIKYTDLYNPFQTIDENKQKQNVEGIDKTAVDIQSPKLPAPKNKAHEKNIEQLSKRNVLHCKPVHVPLAGNKCFNYKKINKMIQKLKDIKKTSEKIVHKDVKHKKPIKNKYYLTTDEYTRVSPEFLELLKQNPAPKAVVVNAYAKVPDTSIQRYPAAKALDNAYAKVFEDRVHDTDESQNMDPNFMRYLKNILQSDIINKLYVCDTYNSVDSDDYNDDSDYDDSDDDKSGTISQTKLRNWSNHSRHDNINNSYSDDNDQLRDFMDPTGDVNSLRHKQKLLSAYKNKVQRKINATSVQSIRKSVEDRFWSILTPEKPIEKRLKNVFYIQPTIAISEHTNFDDEDQTLWAQSYGSDVSIGAVKPKIKAKLFERLPPLLKHFGYIRKFYNFAIDYQGKRDGYYEPWDIPFPFKGFEKYSRITFLRIALQRAQFEENEIENTEIMEKVNLNEMQPITSI